MDSALQQPLQVQNVHDLASPSNWSNFHHYSPNETISLPEFRPLLDVAPPRFEERSAKLTSVGLSGDITDVLAVLDTCLQVGKIQRAEVILRRIVKLELLDTERLFLWHNRFLKASALWIAKNPSPMSIDALHNWFEIYIHGAGYKPTTETLAYMLQASLAMPLPEERTKSVERYMDFVPDDNAMLDLVGLGILDHKELATIHEICPFTTLAEELGLERLEEPDEPAVLESQPTSTDTGLQIDEIRPVEQKGLSLKTLLKSLGGFRESRNSKHRLSQISVEQQRQVQIRLESDAVESALDRWREENLLLKKIGLDTKLQTKSISARLWLWQQELEQFIKDEVKRCDEADAAKHLTKDMRDRCLYGPFLRSIEPSKMSAITLLTILSAFSQSSDKGMVLLSTVMMISKAIQDECLVEQFHQANKKVSLTAVRMRRRAMAVQAQRRANKSAASTDPAPAGILLNDQHTPEYYRQESWPASIQTMLGALLASAVIDIAKLPVLLEHPETTEQVRQVQPAFFHDYVIRKGKKIGVIRVNPALIERLKKEPTHNFLAKQLPMITQPDPWTEYRKGGYISHPGCAMRIKAGDIEQKLYAQASIARGDMKEMFSGLDVLGKTAWNINKGVLDVMVEAWNSGEVIGKIPAETPEVSMPPEPEGIRTEHSATARRRWLESVKARENKISGLHSQRCFINLQLEIARSMADETFYFPHNVDFRGRAYPIPPYLNHMGADHCRALLQFAEGKEIGGRGLQWMKVHAANVFGYDKASIADREQFAMDNLEHIRDSATNPLGGDRWWLQAEDPWQCLAVSMELNAAYSLPDPTKHVSKLPVHQDGTCNGLQHYAALGGDVWGAQQVNLEPSDRPADVYASVAALVEEDVLKDVATNHPLAKLITGKVTRKIVKQTVMTNVYGVTMIGAQAQIRKQLEDAHPDLYAGHDTVTHTHLQMSIYLARKVFLALSTMFSGAHDIQNWLGQCARRICTSLTSEQLVRLEAYAHSIETEKPTRLRKFQMDKLEQLTCFKTSVIWTSPLNMPVVQPYRASKTKQIKTIMQKLCIKQPTARDDVNLRKQLQAFPPNFIHSLDATHMILSALGCDKAGLQFAAVHDSFWTHAADVDRMNVILRDCFIRVHSEDVIGRIAAEFAARYKGSMYRARIRLDSKVGRRISKLRDELATNSLATGHPRRTQAIRQNTDELLMEYKRIKLLASSDPEEVKQGKEMITPATILLANEKAAEVPEEPTIESIFVDDACDEVDTLADQDHNTELDLPTVDKMADYEETEKPKRKKSSVKNTKWTYVWLPFELPPVPKKVLEFHHLSPQPANDLQGEFDVTRLKQSSYFFS